jgi:calcineurin-like phosphoesterase family protein
MIKLFKFIKFVLFVWKQERLHKNRIEPIGWFTSDIHYGHRNVINYCDRPFFSTHQMNKWITRYWNAVVKPFDIIHVLGDFSINPKHHAKYLPRLNGKKILIAGNHDHCLQFASGKGAKRDKAFNAIKPYWDVIAPDGTVKFVDYPDSIMMHHMPFANEVTAKIDSRYWDKRPKDQGQILLHGHQHNRYRKNGRLIDVGFDGGLCFLSEDDIIKLIKDPRDFIPSRITNWYIKHRGQYIKGDE